MPYAHLVGTQQRVLATDIASDRKHLVAHTKGYVQVLLPHQQEWLGCTLLVSITHAAKFHVRGEVLQQHSGVLALAGHSAVLLPTAQLPGARTDSMTD